MLFYTLDDLLITQSSVSNHWMQAYNQAQSEYRHSLTLRIRSMLS